MALSFRLREPNWWMALDGNGRWEMCRHADGVFYYGWSGVVDDQPAYVDLGGQRRRVDALKMIELHQPGIGQLVRERRAAKAMEGGS